MNLENIWMFEGDAFYCPNQLLFLEPLFKHSGIDFEQFVTTIKQAAVKLPEPKVMAVDKSGVAHVSIKGALMPNRSLLMQAMGGTSTTDVNNAFREIQRNPKIKGVFMHVNSPGGSIGGIDQTAELIHNVRQEKPIVGQITGTASSAGYYLASQANKLFATSRTNSAGSVGTRMVLTDASQAAEKAGIKRIAIDTGPNKSLGVPGLPVTADQQAHLQDQVNTLQRYFEQSVQRGRPNIDMGAINDGSNFLAEQAQQRGLIDGIQSAERTNEILHTMIKIRGR
jgi:signal peptide peptidase SppA